MADTADLVNALQSSHGAGALPAPMVVNPLAAMSGAVQTASGIYDLRAKQATEAMGEAYQSAIDPQTGRFDPLKFQTLLSQNPRAAMAAQSGVTSGQALQGAQFQLNSAQNSALNSALAGLLKLPNDQLANGVVQQTQRLISAGILPPDRAHAALLGLNGQDPATLRTQLETIWRGTLPTEQQQAVTYGTVHTQTGPGGMTTSYRVDPTTGALTPGSGGAPQGLSPSELMTQVDVPDLRKEIDGKPNPGYLQSRKMPLWQFYGMPQPPAMGGSGADLGTGRPPAALVNPNGPQPPAQQPAPGGGNTAAQPAPYTQPVTASPGEEGEAKLAPAQFQAESKAGTDATAQQAVLGTMLSDLSRFTAGSGAARTLDWKRAAVSWAPGLARLAGIDPKEVAAQETFDKAAAQLVQAQNPGSDGRMNLNMAATPHSSQSPEGVDFIIRTLQGNADYLQARAALARTYANRSDYNGFTKSIQNLDPRVFQLERMTGDQRTDYLKSLDDGTKGTILQSAKLVAQMRKDGKL